MPNFNQLPQSDYTNADDILPVNQAGRTVAVSVATLQASLQPEIILPRNMLLGRTSIGTGGPEPITVGAGLSLASGMLSVNQSGLVGPVGPAGQGFVFRGAWSAGTDYAAYDVVTYAGQSYVATAPLASGQAFDPTGWTLMAAQGAAGAPGAAGQGFNFRGGWAPSISYVVNDVVTMGGQTYLAYGTVAASTSFDPTRWTLLAAKGDTGAAGIAGPQGPAGRDASVTIGTTAGTVAAGDDRRILGALQPTGTYSIATGDASGGIAWGSIRTSYDQIKANLGTTPPTAWPGGGDYGVVSAVTGAVNVPAAADANLIGEVPGIIVAAGLSGLAINNSAKAPGVGVYGGAGLNVSYGSVWGANFTSKNSASNTGSGSTPFNGNVTGIEIDLNLNTPAGGWAGSNADGLWIPGTFDAQPDGQLNAVHVGVEGAAPWKNAFKLESGAASYAREVGASSATGTANGTFDMFIVRDSSGSAKQIIQGYDFNGRLVIRPLAALASGGTGLRLQDATGSDKVVLDGATGGVTGTSAAFSGDVEASTLGVGSNLAVSGTATIGTVRAGSVLVTDGQGAHALARQDYVDGRLGLFAPVRTVTSGTSVTVLATDGVVRIKKVAGSASSVTLEANPVAGATHTIKDAKGDAAANPITVTAASGTIDGAASLVIATNYQAVTLQWSGDEWSVI